LDTRIVLVRPRNPLNIAAAARAMRNFGFEDLVLVSAYEPVWQDARAAPGAKDLLRSARVVPRLLDALDDRTLVFGTSSLTRRRPAQPVFPLPQIGELLEAREEQVKRLAILFGSEKTGLSNQDLVQCHAVLRIPTEKSTPSMNLGQAVAVCCYELARHGRNISGESRAEVNESLSAVATAGELDRLSEVIDRLAGQGAESAQSSARRRSAQVRQILLRGRLSSKDVTLLLGVLRDLDWKINHGGEKRSKVPPFRF
jgi:TrmH family RNA methyltransferase